MWKVALIPGAPTVFNQDSHPTSIGRDEPPTIPISQVSVVRIVDKRLGSAEIEYKCELGSQWMSSAIVQRMQMGSVRMRSYEEGLVRAAYLEPLRSRKRKFLEG